MVGLPEADGGVQELFVGCLRDRGVLARAGEGDVQAFRAFLLGVVRKVALRLERERGRRGSREKKAEPALEERPADEEGLSRVFDRAWAQSLAREAADVRAKRAREDGEDSLRRVELLRLRFHEGLPIRRIAELWGADPARVRDDSAQAGTEFVRALREGVARRYPASPEALKRVVGDVLNLLG